MLLWEIMGGRILIPPPPPLRTNQAELASRHYTRSNIPVSADSEINLFATEAHAPSLHAIKLA